LHSREVGRSVCELLGHPAPSALLHNANRLVAPPDGNPAGETALYLKQAGLRDDAQKGVARIRQLCLSCVNAADSKQTQEHLSELYRRVRILSAHAGLIGFTKIAEVSGALEGLLFELIFKLSEPTSSTFQTVADAVDCLDRLVRATTQPLPNTDSIRLLVVADDAVCNLAPSLASRNNLRCSG
jgi:chemotaxis protein histidine kinase CheA